MASALDRAKALAIQIGLDYLTGRKPQVYEQPDGSLVLRWSESDEPAVSAMLERQFRRIQDQPPGPVRVDFAPVVARAGFSLFGGLATGASAAVLGVAAAAGYFLGRK